MPAPFGDGLSVSIRDYIDTRLRDYDRAVLAAMESMNARLQAMNEFRSTLENQAKTFVTRLEHDALMADIRSLRESRAEAAGKASQGSVNFATMLAVSGLIISLAGFILALASFYRGG